MQNHRLITYHGKRLAGSLCAARRIIPIFSYVNNLDFNGHMEPTWANCLHTCLRLKNMWVSVINALLIDVSFLRRSSQRSSGSMLIASNNASAGSMSLKEDTIGSGCKSHICLSSQSFQGYPGKSRAWFGCCNEWVISTITGIPAFFIKGMLRISTTRSLYPKNVPRSVSMTSLFPEVRTLSTA